MKPSFFEILFTGQVLSFRTVNLQERNIFQSLFHILPGFEKQIITFRYTDKSLHIQRNRSLFRKLFQSIQADFSGNNRQDGDDFRIDIRNIFIGVDAPSPVHLLIDPVSLKEEICVFMEFFSVDDHPLNRGRPPVFRKQGRMDVQAAMFRQGKNLFRKNVFQIETVMPDAMGLRPNDPVIAKGTTVGSVTKVFYDRDGVHVQAQLEAPVEFHEGYEITVVSTSILGGRQLVLREGDESAAVVEDVRHLVGRKPSDLMEDATEAVARVREFLETDALTNLYTFSESLKVLGLRLENGEGTLGRLLSSDDEMYTNLNAAVANIKLISDRLEKGEGTLGKLLSSDDELYRNVNGTVTDARELLDDMREANTLSTFTSLLLSGF